MFTARRLLLPLLLLAGTSGQARAQAPIRQLKIDPLLLASVKEYRHILEAIGGEIYPGWTWSTIPLLLYRPKVQDILLNAPRRPAGYAPFTGRTVLPDRTIYARNDSTARDIDGQNTSMTLDSMRVLVVSDQYSRERQQFQGMVGQPDSTVARWLDDWRFIQSPYDELQILLHEAFHVHQDRLAPNKSADEQTIAHYPVLDPANNALVALEARLLRAAVLESDAARRRARIEQFIAVRALRRASLDSSAIAYENLNEFSEGTARYVQLRFLQLGEKLTPVPEMYLYNGFTGYRGVLRQLLVDKLDDLVKVASFSDNRFGNRFGGGPLRYRLYDTGGIQGLLLDEVAPDWKTRIFGRGIYLTDLLTAAIPLSAERRAALVAQAKAEYGYDSIFVNRQAFEREGRRLIQQRVDAILNSSRTLVSIDYGAVGDIDRMSYTPFGVTAVDAHTAIYDLVPIAIRFGNRVVLRMKSVVPMLIDRQAKTVTFAVASAPAAFEGKGPAGLDLPELTLGASPGTTITISGNRVSIALR